MKPCRYWFCVALLLPGLLFAHGDEDHGDAANAPVAPTVRALRVEAASESFELVGQLQGDKLVIHLDRFATNAPVTGAKVDVEGGPLKLVKALERDGVYTVPAADATDLLTGDLVVASPEQAAVAGATGVPPTRWIAVAAAAAFVAGAALFARRRRRASSTGALP
jgi:hypothetical protein